jgi:hypothetical protein
MVAGALQRHRALEEGRKEGRNSAAKDTPVAAAPISALCSAKRDGETVTPISKRFKDFAHNLRS